MTWIPRLHLVELEDLESFPTLIRDYGTDYLRFIQAHLELHLPMVDVVADALERTGETKIVDLCSGGGGPTPGIIEALRDRGIDVTATLTDRFPNEAAAKECERASEHCRYHRDSVDATSVPPDLEGEQAGVREGSLKLVFHQISDLVRGGGTLSPWLSR